MNFRYVFNQFGLLIVVFSAVMLALAGLFFGTEVVLREQFSAHALRSLLLSSGIGIVLGGATWLITRSPDHQLGRREAMLLVSLSWFVGAAFAALPFLLWAHFQPTIEDHPFHHYVNCYFEAMSGLTTTGATILNDIQTVPKSLLLWRAFTHWLGGLGIVVLFVAVLPSLGVGGKKLFRVEAPGPTQQGLRPHIRETARVLLYIYCGMTATCIFALRLTGAMGWFDSICHAFSMLSTGGLSTRDASIGYYDSVAVDIICIIFMLAAGVNFALFYEVARKRFRTVWKDVELRVYLILKILVIAIVSYELIDFSVTTSASHAVDPATTQAARYGAFQTIALHTGTGFVTADYDLWPYVTLSLLCGLMFIGGCAGSTAGGIKVIRLWIVIKTIIAELEKAFRPNVVRPVRVGGTPLDHDQKLGAVVYVVTFFALIGIGAFVIRLCESGSTCDTLTAMSASLSTIANVGPGLHGVGPTKTYLWFSDGSKLVMSLLMALGRLEVFAIFVLLTPRFWRGT